MISKPSRSSWVSTGWILAVGLVAFFPILFLGRSYDANDLIQEFAPMRIFLKDSLAHGILPLWNPTLFCGQPFFADLQNQLLYPFFWLTVPFSVGFGMSLFTALHWVLAALGMRLWLRTLGISEAASLMGALIYALSGDFWWEIIHPPILVAFAWFPFWLAALEALVRKPSARRGWLAGTAFALLFLGGSFQISLTAFYAGITYASARLWASDDPEPRPNRRKVILGVLGIALGSAVVLMQVWPTQEFSKLSVRDNAPGESYENFNALWSLQPNTITQFLFPRVGLPPGKSLEQAIQEITPDYGNDFLANFGYLGVWVPFLFFWAFRERQKKLAWSLGALGGLGLLTAFGKYFFLHKWVCTLVPGFNLLRAPFRYIVLYTLAGSALAALGIQALSRPWGSVGETRGRRTAVWSYAGLLILVGLANPVACWREILALLLGAAGLTLLGKTKTVQAGKGFLAFGLCAPLVLSGWADFASHPSSNLDLKAAATWAASLPQDEPGQRQWLDPSLNIKYDMEGTTYALNSPINLACALGLKVPSGYNPLKLKGYSEVESLPFPALSALTALKRMVFPRRLQQDIPGYQPVEQNGLVVYQSQSPRPQVYAPQRWILEENPDQRLARMKSQGFNPYQESILSAPSPSGVTLQSLAKPITLGYQLTDENPNHQSWSVQAPLDAVVVFTEAGYPDWKATLDGQGVPILEANEAFRAVFVPAGSHRISFDFIPPWKAWLFPGLSVWACLSLALFLFSGRKPTEA